MNEPRGENKRENKGGREEEDRVGSTNSYSSATSEALFEDCIVDSDRPESKTCFDQVNTQIGMPSISKLYNHRSNV